MQYEYIFSHHRKIDKDRDFMYLDCLNKEILSFDIQNFRPGLEFQFSESHDQRYDYI